MPSRIDDKTVVPLSTVVVVVVCILGGAIKGAFWVKSVDDRLGLIMNHLGIHEVKSDAIDDASASEGE